MKNKETNMGSNKSGTVSLSIQNPMEQNFVSEKADGSEREGR